MPLGGRLRRGDLTVTPHRRLAASILLAFAVDAEYGFGEEQKLSECQHTNPRDRVQRFITSLNKQALLKPARRARNCFSEVAH